MESQQQKPEVERTDISIRLIRESDLDIVDSIFRLAFGTLIDLQDPTRFGGDSDYVRTRWLADPTAAFGAEFDNVIVGSCFVTNWGSIGILGPLSVHPDLWNRGIAKRLLEPAIELFSNWGIKQAGLVTSATSIKHIDLYKNFGFWPRFHAVIMSKQVRKPDQSARWSRYSDVPESNRTDYLRKCYLLTDAIFGGLNLEQEIRAVDTQGFGDTVLIWKDAKLVGLAVCHSGPGSEAGSGTCLVKFGGVLPGVEAEKTFNQLLDACEALAVEQGMSRLIAGINKECNQAYRIMLAHGFHTVNQSVAMYRPYGSGYHRHDIYAIDDWR